MKVLLAGASGALGTPFDPCPIAKGHEVLGLARSLRVWTTSLTLALTRSRQM